MKKLLDLATWNRKDHFNFFNTFEEPFFGVTVDLDCTKAYKTAKAMEVSFFQFYLHKSLTLVTDTNTRMVETNGVLTAVKTATQENVVKEILWMKKYNFSP